jgi:hypothetical protein
MKAIVPQAVSREFIEFGCFSRTTKRTACAKTSIVEQD